MSLAELSATQAARKIRDGKITSVQLVRACLERIERVDGEIQAWAHLDPAYALQQAQILDDRRQAGEATGPLHGVPVGIKDICDTASLPTQNGTVLDAGRQPEKDSRVVSLLRQAGAVIMGKTVTTELAVFGPGKTRNPHNPRHTPGGSSSGSTAAVAAFMVPLAIGTQTNGSIIRPASYCGVFGFKPTHGLIPRTGVLSSSPPLDTIGAFARSIADIALLTEAMIGFDPGDQSSRPRARPPLVEMAAAEPPSRPAVGFAKTAVWDQAEAGTKQAFERLAERLGDECHELHLPKSFDRVVEMHRHIMYADLAKNYDHYFRRGETQLSETLRRMIETGRQISAVDYNNAVAGQRRLNSELNSVFDDYDIIITPAATGEAPAGLQSTGNPIFNTLATYCGVPSITLPLISGPNGLPLGVQVIGRRGDDARLLRSANWLTRRINS